MKWAGVGDEMAVTVEMQNTGDPALRQEVVATVEHVLSDRAGDWRVSIIGSQTNDRWEMKITGPNAFERSYTLEGTLGEHRPEMIRVLLGKLLPRWAQRVGGSRENKTLFKWVGDHVGDGGAGDENC